MKPTRRKKYLFPTLIFSLRNKRKRHDSFHRIRNDIAKMDRLFSHAPFEVYLVGGVGLAIRKEHFYRNHRDFDIAVFTDDLLALNQHLNQHGYTLVNKFFSGHVSPRYNLQLVTIPDIPSIPKKQYTSLKLRALADNGRKIRMLRQRIDYFDVFLLGPQKEGIKMLGYNTLVPWQDFLPVVPVLGHPTLTLPNKQYKAYLPVENSRMEKDLQLAGLQD